VIDLAAIFDSNALRSVAYVVAAALALLAGLRERQARRGMHSVVPAFWFGLAALLLFFGISRELEIAPWITGQGRDFAKDHGWYEERRRFQRPAVELIFGGGLVLIGLGLFWFFRAVYREHPLAFIAIVYILCFIAIRTISLHQVDHILYSDRFGGFRPNAMLELFGCALMALATLPVLLRSAPAVRPAPAPVPLAD